MAAKRSGPEAGDGDGDILQGIGRKVFDARKGLGLTQAQLGSRVGLPQPNIFEIEHGLVNFGVKTLEKLALALEVDMRDLLPGDSNALPSQAQLIQLITSFDRFFMDALMRLGEAVKEHKPRGDEAAEAFRNISRLRALLAHFVAATEGSVGLSDPESSVSGSETVTVRAKGARKPRRDGK